QMVFMFQFCNTLFKFFFLGTRRLRDLPLSTPVFQTCYPKFTVFSYPLIDLPIRESSFSCTLFVRLSGFYIFFYGSKTLIDGRFSFCHKEASRVFFGIFMTIIQLYPSIEQVRTTKMVFFAERC